jgi:hypothetical protein
MRGFTDVLHSRSFMKPDSARDRRGESDSHAYSDSSKQSCHQGELISNEDFAVNKFHPFYSWSQHVRERIWCIEFTIDNQETEQRWPGRQRAVGGVPSKKGHKRNRQKLDEMVPASNG